MMSDIQDPKDLADALVEHATEISQYASYISEFAVDVIDDCGPGGIAKLVSIELLAARCGLLAELMIRKAGSPGCFDLGRFVLPREGLKISRA